MSGDGIDDILDKSRSYLTESFASGGGDQSRAEMLGDQLTQLLLAKNGGDTGHGFRDDVRQYGLTLRKDNTKLRDQLLNNQADLDTIVKKGREGLRTADQEQELKDMQDYNQRHAVGVDDIKDFPQDGDDAEGDLKARNQPKIAGLEGIEFETGNS